jgi:hypothetical protein
MNFWNQALMIGARKPDNIANIQAESAIKHKVVSSPFQRRRGPHHQKDFGQVSDDIFLGVRQYHTD